MTLQIAIPQDEIAAFCQKWGIEELSVFGSALRDDFSDESDIDFLAEFKSEVSLTIGDLLDMEAELEAIFHRKIDIGSKSGVESDPNYIRRKAILGSAQVIFKN